MLSWSEHELCVSVSKKNNILGRIRFGKLRRVLLCNRLMNYSLGYLLHYEFDDFGRCMYGKVMKG